MKFSFITPRDRVVLERLALHHVAPMTRRVADRQQDRLVLRLRARERFRPPRIPIDRIVRMLPQVRTLFVDQPVRLAADVTFGIFRLAHESRIILSASRSSVIPSAPPCSRVASAPVTIRCYAISPARRLRPDFRRDSVLRPPSAARRGVVVVGISMGRNCARDAGDAQLLLADDQRPRLLRQAARLVLARNFFDTIHRRPQRDCYAPPMRDRGTARSGDTHAAHCDASTTLAPRYSPASSSPPASASYSFRATPAPTSKLSPANSPHCCSSLTTRNAAAVYGSSRCG